jgi:F-type H+-transporting ATPase subunit delta
LSDQDGHIAGMPGRYARALFDLALESKNLDKVAKDLAAILGMIAASKDFERLVISPVFTADEQKRSVMAILKKAKIKGLSANFMGLVAENRRLFAFENMVKAYTVMLARHRGEISAEITSAQKLSAKQVKDLKAALKSVAGRDVTLESKIDESLLGGLIVKVGSRMVDTSLKNKLDNLKIAMKEVG